MTDVVPVPVRQLDPELPLPAYAHPGDAGADLVAAADVELPPGGRALVPTGVAHRAARGLRRAGASRAPGWRPGSA